MPNRPPKTPVPQVGDRLYTWRFQLTGGPVHTGHGRYSLTAFWDIYRRTFDNNPAVSSRPPIFVDLISDLGPVIRVWPKPEAFGKYQRQRRANGQSPCTQCDQWYPTGDLTDAIVDGDSGNYCHDCLENLEQCDRCRQFTASTDKIQDIEADWCKTCRTDHAIQCDSCGDWYSHDAEGVTDNNGEWHCLYNNCEDGYNYCHGCDRYFANRNTRYSESRDETYCTGCYEDLPSDDEDENSYGCIHDYDFKPRAIFHGDPKQTHYGVENEVTVSRSTAPKTIEVLGGGTHAYCKNDSSIVDSGYEIVTHPHTFTAMRDIWKPFFAHAKRMGMDGDGNGMHVHIERSKLTKYRIGLIQSFLNREENTPFIFTIAQRSWADAAVVKPELAAHGRIRSYGDGDRYSALNLSNHATIEIRIFRATVDEAEFNKNMEFCDALVHWTIDLGHADLSVKRFCSFVRQNRKRYPNLDTFLVSHAYLPAVKPRAGEIAVAFTPAPTQESIAVCA